MSDDKKRIEVAVGQLWHDPWDGELALVLRHHSGLHYHCWSVRGDGGGVFEPWTGLTTRHLGRNYVLLSREEEK